MAKYWLFNTDETEEVGVGKHEVMLARQVIAAHGWCKGKGAERTLNQPVAGDIIFYYRADFGFVGCAKATSQFATPTNQIFNATGEYMRPVEQVQILTKNQIVTAAEVKSSTGFTTSYRHIVSQIHSQEVIDYLLKRFKKIKVVRAKKKTAKKGSAGGGFQPCPKKRKSVEKAAVKHVEKFYRGQGWKVDSVEKENVGYDLYCVKGNQVACVEVKGTSGVRQDCILTANEFRSANENKDFVLCIVTNAITKPSLKKYSAKQLFAKFEMNPLSYWVKFKD